MSEDRYRTALELIAGLDREARFFWTDKSGRLREQMVAADLARAVLNDLVDLDKVSQERRTGAR